MDLTITIKDGSDHSRAFARAHAAYNVDNPGVTQQAFLQMLVNGQINHMRAAYAAEKDKDAHVRASKLVTYVVVDEGERREASTLHRT